MAPGSFWSLPSPEQKLVAGVFFLAAFLFAVAAVIVLRRIARR